MCAGYNRKAVNKRFRQFTKTVPQNLQKMYLICIIKHNNTKA